ncbi:MAG: RHS repeat-associated core domain-containing protein [Solirubrobacteraceae bacterium]|nr:RHS repeat-associated core domain-containing protein [Solirubrobacteraceae bacterium]
MASTTDWRGTTVSFGYDANSNLVGETFPAASGEVDSFTYNNVDVMLTAQHNKASTALAAFTYTRDEANRVKTQSTTVISEPAQTFGYTDNAELNRAGATATPTAFAYDAAGQLTARGNASTQTYDAAGQLCWATTTNVSSPSCTAPPTGAAKFTFDASGNRTKRTESSGTSTSYAYDDNGYLKTYTPSSGGATTYKTDADGRRVSKTAGGVTTKWAWDTTAGLDALLYDGSTSYVYGPGGRVVTVVPDAGTSRYLHQDQLGSTRLVTAQNGSTLATYTYDAYGSVTAKTGTATTPIGYAGQYTDAESGLIYMRARMYDPVTGQFMSRDPLAGLSGQPYGYANGDPANSIDPSGQFFWLIPMAMEAMALATEATVLMAEAAETAAVMAEAAEGAAMAAEAGEAAAAAAESEACLGEIVNSDIDFALQQMTRGGRATSREIDDFASRSGLTRSQSANGPIKYTDENGVTRVTIKQGSSRAPGSGDPHVELRNSSGQRVDSYGNPVTRRSPGNHQTIQWNH